MIESGQSYFKSLYMKISKQILVSIAQIFMISGYWLGIMSIKIGKFFAKQWDKWIKITLIFTSAIVCILTPLSFFIEGLDHLFILIEKGEMDMGIYVNARVFLLVAVFLIFTLLSFRREYGKLILFFFASMFVSLLLGFILINLFEIKDIFTFWKFGFLIFSTFGMIIPTICEAKRANIR